VRRCARPSLHLEQSARRDARHFPSARQFRAARIAVRKLGWRIVRSGSWTVFPHTGTMSRSGSRAPALASFSARSASMRRQCCSSAPAPMWFRAEPFGSNTAAAQPTERRRLLDPRRRDETSAGQRAQVARAHTPGAPRDRPRWKPRATKARSIDVGESARQSRAAWWHLFEIAGRALEVGETFGRLHRAVATSSASSRFCPLCSPRV